MPMDYFTPNHSIARVKRFNFPFSAAIQHRHYCFILLHALFILFHALFLPFSVRSSLEPYKSDCPAPSGLHLSHSYHMIYCCLNFPS